MESISTKNCPIARSVDLITERNCKQGSEGARFCAGVFVVTNHMDEKRARDVIGKRWFKNYDQSVRKHFRGYKRRRKKKRTMYGSDKHWRLHILVGHKTKSFWMGKSGIHPTRYQE